MSRPESTRASENAGSRAQARFLYQHHYIAYWCIQMLIDSDIEFIVCEHHDDFYIRWRDGNYHFVQVKTRADGEGEWTIAKITARKNSQDPKTGSSILQKLYEKHRVFGDGRTNRYVLISDMGAGEPSTPNLHTLETLSKKGPTNWESDDKAAFEQIFEDVKSKVSSEDEVSLRNFLLSFEFRKWQPNTKQSLERFNHSELREVLHQLHGLYYGDPEIRSVYEEILGVIRDANVVEDDANLDKSVEEKTIRLKQITSAIAIPPREKVYLERHEILSSELDKGEAQQLSKLQEKTQAAGWDPDATMHLMDLRAARNLFYRKHRHFEVIRKRLDDLSLKVQRICVYVKIKSKDDKLDGYKQWLLLDRYLTELAAQNSTQFPQIDVDYLFGEAGNLTGKCKIRWV